MADRYSTTFHYNFSPFTYQSGRLTLYIPCSRSNGLVLHHAFLSSLFKLVKDTKQETGTYCVPPVSSEDRNHHDDAPAFYQKSFVIEGFIQRIRDQKRFYCFIQKRTIQLKNLLQLVYRVRGTEDPGGSCRGSRRGSSCRRGLNLFFLLIKNFLPGETGTPFSFFLIPLVLCFCWKPPWGRSLQACPVVNLF
jgi:hypothetical protein